MVEGDYKKGKMKKREKGNEFNSEKNKRRKGRKRRKVKVEGDYSWWWGGRG